MNFGDSSSRSMRQILEETTARSRRDDCKIQWESGAERLRVLPVPPGSPPPCDSQLLESAAYVYQCSCLMYGFAMLHDESHPFPSDWGASDVSQTSTVDAGVAHQNFCDHNFRYPQCSPTYPSPVPHRLSTHQDEWSDSAGPGSSIDATDLAYSYPTLDAAWPSADGLCDPATQYIQHMPAFPAAVPSLYSQPYIPPLVQSDSQFVSTGWETNHCQHTQSYRLPMSEEDIFLSLTGSHDLRDPGVFHSGPTIGWSHQTTEQRGYDNHITASLSSTPPLHVSDWMSYSAPGSSVSESYLSDNPDPGPQVTQSHDHRDPKASVTTPYLHQPEVDLPAHPFSKFEPYMESITIPGDRPRSYTVVVTIKVEANGRHVKYFRCPEPGCKTSMSTFAYSKPCR
ncbi:hypothetical protein BN946_scf184999.g27 [Trametes cinnabarina]|uniref:Uncharacterized protein n=1 Tax=Pycnoporus cinnabarinus TaxID=5643 RepID=A0A060S7D3_PYCCI|nr:hypothetical protein BN946_scf184999.g27 [Trametes cinnabarina]